MVQLSVVIVNYNVKYFLEQCLLSVRQAMAGINGEVWVVDNASADGSVEMVRQRFPEVQLIANDTNTGFAVANNQAIRLANGAHILLLNPDTVVAEDTFRQCLAFMEAHPEAGGLGVKMLDGKGQFLPESKRAFPSPSVAFYKAVGLAALFPHSPVFGRYHLGHLSADETHEVEVLAGAFMWLRKEALDKVGLLDETYFMYGEDIDLSYRLIQGGYKNYYLADAPIIHYKGESTKKGSLNYVKLFYQAMAIFVQQHIGRQQARLFSLFIHLAIYAKALLHLLSGWLRGGWAAIADAALLYGGLYVLQEYWASNIKNAPDYYPAEYVTIVLPVYILLWLTAIFFSGGYDKPFRVSKAIRGIAIGTVAILALYGLVDESYRFSRAIILLGAGWGVFVVMLSRSVYHLMKHGSLTTGEPRQKRQLIVGSPQEGERVLSLLQQAGVNTSFIGFIAPEGNTSPHPQLLGTVSQLAHLVAAFRINEIIFCSKDISYRDTLHWIQQLGPDREYKMVPEQGLSIIGSNNRNTAGDLYAADLSYRISTPMQRRNKRVFDLLVWIVLALAGPLLMWATHPVRYWKHGWMVFVGQRTWVGYAPTATPSRWLPPLKQGILQVHDGVDASNTLDAAVLDKMNYLYARDYSTQADLRVLLLNWRLLGR